MGGLGSGRRPTTRLAERTPRILVGELARARRNDAPIILSWKRSGAVILRLVAVADGDTAALITNDTETQSVALVEKPSNLGRGHLLYARCACGRLTRTLWRGRRWACRRCAGVVYQSSRDSDARITAIMRGDEAALTLLKRPTPSIDGMDVAGLTSLLSAMHSATGLLMKIDKRMARPPRRSRAD